MRPRISVTHSCHSHGASDCPVVLLPVQNAKFPIPTPCCGLYRRHKSHGDPRYLFFSCKDVTKLVQFFSLAIPSNYSQHKLILSLGFCDKGIHQSYFHLALRLCLHVNKTIVLYGDQAVSEGRGCQKYQSQPMKSISANQPFLGKEVFFSCSLCTEGGSNSLATWNHWLATWNHRLCYNLHSEFHFLPQLLPLKPSGPTKSVQGSEVPGKQIKFRSGSWNIITVVCLIQDMELWGLYGWERDKLSVSVSWGFLAVLYCYLKISQIGERGSLGTLMINSQFSWLRAFQHMLVSTRRVSL